jgi:hypothetical protein
MIHRRIKRVDGDYVVTIPKDEIERRGLHDGQLVGVVLLPVEDHSDLSLRIEEILNESFDKDAEAYRILFDEELESTS